VSSKTGRGEEALCNWRLGSFLFESLFPLSPASSVAAGGLSAQPAERRAMKGEAILLNTTARLEIEQQSMLSQVEAQCSVLQSVADARAAINIAEAEVNGLKGKLEAATAARRRLREAAMFKPDPTLKISQKDVDEMRRLKKQPPAVVETVVCAACTLLMQQRRKQQRGFMVWEETVKLLPRCDWFAFKAYDASQLLLAPEVMLAVQARLAVSVPYQFQGQGGGDEAEPVAPESAGTEVQQISEMQAKKSSAAIGKLFSWCDRVIANVEEVRREASEDDRQAGAMVESLERSLRVASEQIRLLHQRLAELEAIERCALEAAALVAATSVPPLDMNVNNARAALAGAQAAGVDEQRLKKASALIESAEKRQQAHNAAAAALNQLIGVAPLALPVKRARTQIDDAQRIGVDPSLVARAVEHTKTAQGAQEHRDVARAEVERLAGINPLKLQMRELEAAIANAIEAGVAEEHLAGARERLAHAKEKQAACEAATAILRGMLSTHALDVEIDGARREIERARACGVAAEVVAQASEHLSSARDAHERRNAAQRRVTQLCKSPNLLLKVQTAREALEAARVAGVPESELSRAQLRVDEAARAQAAEAEARARLNEVTASEPLEMDIVAAMAALETARSRGVDVEVCKERGRCIDAAAKAQAACARCTATLQSLMETSALELCLPDVVARLGEARDAGVSSALISKAEAHATAAKQAQTHREEARKRMHKLVGAPALEMDVPAARAAAEAARGAGVAETSVAQALAAADAAAVKQDAREEAVRELERVCENPALTMDVLLAQAKLKAAFGAGVAREVLDSSKAIIDAAQAAQTVLARAMRCVARLLEQPLLGVDLQDAEAQIVAAAEAGVDADVVEKARVHLGEARAAQAAREQCQSALQEYLARPPLELDVVVARDVLHAAVEAGVPTALQKKAQAHIAEAAKLQEARDSAWAAVTTLMEMPLLSVPLKEARAALGMAKKAAVTTEQVETAKAYIEHAAQAQQTRARAISELEAAIQPAPLNLDVALARQKIEGARAAQADEAVLAAALQKVDGAASAQETRDTALARAEKHGALDLLNVDLEAAKKDLREAREAGVEEGAIANIVVHVKRAAALQAKAATARSDLEAHTSVQLLSMDMVAARAALETAIACKVGTDVTDAAKQRIEAAERARQARDEAAAELKALLQEKSLQLALADARTKLALGREAGVEPRLLDKVDAHVVDAANAQAKVGEDLQALCSRPSLDIDVARARICLEVALSVASITLEATSEAKMKIDAAEDAQRARDAAAAKVKALLEEAALELDVASAWREHKEALSAGVDTALLDKVAASINFAQGKQAARDGATAELLRLTSTPILEMDVRAAQAAQVAAIEAGVAEAAVHHAAAAIAAAIQAQTARQEMAARVDGLLAQDVLTVDVTGSQRLLDEARAASVDTETLERAQGHISAAKSAQAERAAAEAEKKARKEAAAEAVERLLQTELLQLREDSCEFAISEATAAGVDAKLVASLQRRMDEAVAACARRDEAAAELEQLVQQDSLLLDVAGASKALEAAKTAGVQEDSINDASRRIATATLAQEAAAGADKALDRVLELPLVYVEVEEAKAEIDRAKKQGASSAKVDRAAQHVEKAIQAQQALDDASQHLQELISTAPLDVDIAPAKAMIERGRAVGVDEYLIRSALERVTTAESEQMQQAQAAVLIEKYVHMKDDMIRLEEARDALARARDGGAPPRLIAQLGERLDVITEAREIEVAKAEKELVATPPLELDLRASEQRVEELLHKHIPEPRLTRMREAIQAARKVQERRDEAWNKLLALADAPPGEMDVELAQEIFKEAWEAGVDEERLEAIVEIVEKEAEVQQQRDDALADLNSAVDHDTLLLDVHEARRALQVAKTRGVAADQLALAQQLIDQAAAAQKWRDAAKRDEQLMDAIIADDLELENLMDEIA